MSQYEFSGLALLAVSAFHLLPTIGTDTIPTRWPLKPLRREEKPEQYWVTFGVFALAGLVGLSLLIAGLLIRAGF